MKQRAEYGSISGHILHAMGKGFLLACAGMVVGAVFGSPALVASGFWGIVATAAIGASFMVAASAAHSRCSDEDNAAALCRPAVERSIAPAAEIDDPARAAEIEAEDLAVDRFVAQVEAERLLSTGGRRLH